MLIANGVGHSSRCLFGRNKSTIIKPTNEIDAHVKPSQAKL
jgi:hypothetical protein